MHTLTKLKIAIIGFGFMGKTHAINILQSDTMQLQAIVDPKILDLQSALLQAGGNFSTGNIAPASLSAVKVYSSLDTCLDTEPLDAVLVCVHTLMHFEMVQKALSRQLHVFVEKPFVLDVVQGELLVALALQQQRILQVGHVVRFMPAYQKLHEIMHSGVYGALQSISLTRFTGVPNWGEWEKRQTDFGSSGGALFDLVIHDIDFLQYLLGMPDSVNCTYYGGALSAHDYICAHWLYTNNVKVKVEGGNTFHSMFPFEASYKAQFEKASLIWRSSNGLQIDVVDNVSHTTLPVLDGNDGFRDELFYFAHCILHQQQPTKASAQSALDTIRLCYKHIDRD